MHDGLADATANSPEDLHVTVEQELASRDGIFDVLARMDQEAYDELSISI